MTLMEKFKFVVELDHDDSGSFSEDLSADLMAVPSIREGRASTLEGFSGAQVTLALDNADSKYSPRNAGSSLYPYLKRGKRVRVRAQATLPAVTNIDDNPSAETNDLGWGTAGASRARVTDESFVGGACIKYTTMDFNNVGCMKRARSSAGFNVTAGQTYTWAPRGKGPSGKNMTIIIEWWDAGAPFQQDEVPFTFGGGWMQPVITAIAPTGAVKAFLYILTDGAQGVFDFWVDASWFYQGATLEPYCDGTQPGCSWSGTAHESTSNRSVNPYFGFCIGEIADIRLRRGEEPVAELILRAQSQAWMAQEVDLAEMQNDAATIIHRLIDRLQGDVGVLEQAFNDWLTPLLGSQEGGSWTGLDATISVQYNVSRTLTFEGISILQANYVGTPAAQSGFRRNVTAITSNEVDYDATCYLYHYTSSGDFRLRISDQAGVISSKTFTPPTAPTRNQRTILASVQWPSTSTSRYVEMVTDSAPSSNEKTILGAWTIQKSSKVVTRVMNVTGMGVAMESARAYQRSGRAMLAEVAASGQGWVREQMDDSPATTPQIVFEDIDTRSSTPIPVTRFVDTVAADGHYFDEIDYAERLSDHHNIFRVGSLGDTQLTGGFGAGVEAELWRLEPAGIAFAADETKRIYANPYTLPGFVGTVSATFDAGGYTLVYALDYNIGGYVEIKKDGTPGNLTALLLTGMGLQQSSERGFVQIDKRVDPTAERARVLEVDMLGQGRATQAMTDVMNYYADRHYHGKPPLALVLSAANMEQVLAILGLRISDPVHVRHDEGRGNMALNDAYYVDGREIRFVTGSLLEATLFLTPA